MGKESKGKEQPPDQSQQRQSTEELRRRAKEALDKANELLAESGKHGVPETPSDEDTKR